MGAIVRLPADLSRTDTLGLGVILLWLAWSVTAALLSGRGLPLTSPYVISPLVAMLGVLVGRRLATPNIRREVARGLLIVVAIVALGQPLIGGPRGGPLGYANADAALAIQITALAALAAVGSIGTDRQLLITTTLLAAWTGVATLSRAGVGLLVPLLVAFGIALVHRVRHRWRPVAAGTSSIVLAAIGLVILASRDDWPTVATIAFDEARKALWSDAVTLWRESPVVGAGPGSFRGFSPLAQDLDLATAHSSILQVGAETGLIGVALFAALVAVGFLLIIEGSPSATLVASVAWSALVLHSFIDHLLEFPAVVLVAGAVVGWASATDSEKFDVAQGQGPGLR